MGEEEKVDGEHKERVFELAARDSVSGVGVGFPQNKKFPCIKLGLFGGVYLGLLRVLSLLVSPGVFSSFLLLVDFSGDVAPCFFLPPPSAVLNCIITVFLHCLFRLSSLRLPWF